MLEKIRPVLPCDPAAVDDFLSEPPDAVVEMLRRTGGDFMVLGAGGKMGLHLCLMLRKAMQKGGIGGRVTAVSRFVSLHDRDLFEDGGVATQACDLCNPAELAALVPVENMVFMAGAKFGTSGQPDLLQRMNVEMPERVARHFRGSRVSAFSTGCVYSFVPVTSRGSAEDSETTPVGDYARSCLGREEAFRHAAREFQTRTALIRLNYSVEFRYGVLVDIATQVLEGNPVDVSSGHVNVIWQRDAVAQALLAHEHASPDPFVINIAGPEILRVRDLAQRFGEILGREPVFTSAEAATAWLSDSTLARRLFGPPETSVDRMISWISAWLRCGRPTHGKPTGFEKRDGNF